MELILSISVFATDIGDAKRQAAVLAREYNVSEILDVVCTNYSWPFIHPDADRLLEFRCIYSIIKS